MCLRHRQCRRELIKRHPKEGIGNTVLQRYYFFVLTAVNILLLRLLVAGGFVRYLMS